MTEEFTKTLIHVCHSKCKWWHGYLHFGCRPQQWYSPDCQLVRKLLIHRPAVTNINKKTPKKHWNRMICNIGANISTRSNRLIAFDLASSMLGRGSKFKTAKFFTSQKPKKPPRKEFRCYYRRFLGLFSPLLCAMLDAIVKIIKFVFDSIKWFLIVGTRPSAVGIEVAG